MSTLDPQSTVTAAACYECQIPVGYVWYASLGALANLVNGDPVPADSATLIEQARCLECAIPAGMVPYAILDQVSKITLGPPVPTGSCCKDDGSCEVLTQAACALIPGAVWTLGGTCTPNTCPQPFSPFKATVNNGNASPFVLPLVNGPVYDFLINWGDGSPVDHITVWNQAQATHIYPNDNSYQMSITGTMPQWQFAQAGSCNQLLSVDSWGDIAWTTMERAFEGCTNLASLAAGGNFGAVTNFNQAWKACQSLVSFPLLDLSNGTDFTETWQNCIALTSFPSLNLSSGTTFQDTWRSCPIVNFGAVNMSSFAGPIGSLFTDLAPALVTFGACNFASVLSFSGAWNGCLSMTTFGACTMTSGTNFTSAWQACAALTSFPRLNLGAGTGFSDAWSGCTVLASFMPAATGTEMASATNIVTAWFACSSLPSFPAIDFTNVTNATSAFDGCSSLTTVSAVHVTADIGFANCNLDAPNINNIFSNVIDTASKTIDVQGNPGFATADFSLADNKGWTCAGTSPPVNTVAPAVTGPNNPALPADTLTTDDGTWTGVPTPTFTYVNDGFNDGTANNVVVDIADSGNNITFTVTATNFLNSVPANSNAYPCL